VCAEKLAALSPEEWEELVLAHQLEVFEDDTERQIREAKESIEHAWTLGLLIEQGKATNYEKVETVEFLGPAESLDAEDVPDEELESGDESMDPEADPKEVQGTRRRKQGSVKEKKPWTNRKVSDFQLEW
jgi:hypothetical protein